ncbi:MAG: glycerophosphodiester phosphodiesterase [Patescibacteria group bacterium]
MLIFAHRGCSSKQCSENTIEAFNDALRSGADGIEFDLRLSRDGQPIVVHDTNLHRIAGDAHRVSELEARMISKVPLRYGGRVPTLDEVTSVIHAPAILDIEVKHRNVSEALISKLKTSTSLRERTIISSFNKNTLISIKEQLPDIKLMLLIARWPFPLRGKSLWTIIENMEPWAIAFPLMVLTPSRISFLKAKRYRVGAWDRRGSRGEARKAKDLKLDIAIIKQVKEAL